MMIWRYRYGRDDRIKTWWGCSVSNWARWQRADLLWNAGPLRWPSHLSFGFSRRSSPFGDRFHLALGRRYVKSSFDSDDRPTLFAIPLLDTFSLRRAHHCSEVHDEDAFSPSCSRISHPVSTSSPQLFKHALWVPRNVSENEEDQQKQGERDEEQRSCPPQPRRAEQPY